MSFTSPPGPSVAPIANLWRKMKAGEMNEILPNLFVGSRRNASSESELKENNIQHVITVADTEIPHFKEKHPSIKSYTFFEMSDQSSSRFSNEMIEEAVGIIHNARKNNEAILVNCMMGVSRSVTLVSLYIATIHEIEFDHLMFYMTRVRPMARPNCGFRTQINSYIKNFAKLQREHHVTAGCAPLRQTDRQIICKSIPFAVPETV